MTETIDPDGGIGAVPPPPPPAPPPGYVLAKPGQTLSIVAIVLGAVGAIIGLGPFIFGVFAAAFGVAAVILGVFAWRAARSVGGHRGRLGIALGAAALGCGIYGMVTVEQAVNDLDDSFVASDTTDQSATTERDTEAPAVPEPSTPPTTEADTPDIVPVGGWFTWDNGLQAQVTAIERYTPEYDDNPLPDVVVTITVKNGSDKVFDAAMSMMNLYGGPNGVQAESGYDFYGFDGSIPPGTSATAKWSFMVPEEHMSQLRVEFAPGYQDTPDFAEYESAYFTGAAA
jgi:hypothetical protein